MAKPNTRNQGANDERDAVKAYIKRLGRRCPDFRGYADKIIAWLLQRDDRYGKRPRALGK